MKDHADDDFVFKMIQPQHPLPQHSGVVPASEVVVVQINKWARTSGRTHSYPVTLPSD